MDARRRDCAISVLGGPTTVVDIAGRRIVMDPTFDPPGVHAYLTKITGPAVTADALGPVDAVLISHDQHPDNLDDDGRRLALAAPLVLTHPGAAGRLGPPAVGLAPWQSYQLPDVDGSEPLAVQAVPAVHGPADGQRDASGHVNCEVSGFVLSGPGVPTVYLSGDNASIAAVKDVADRVGDIDICTALQLTNFWQDVAIDFSRDRIYLPQEDLARFNYTLDDLRAGLCDTRWRRLLAFEIARTRDLFERGRGLPEEVRFQAPHSVAPDVAGRN